MQAATRPGLAKVQRERLVQKRERSYYRISSHALTDVLLTADVISEGDWRSERGERIYYGTSSLWLSHSLLSDYGVVTPEATAALLADPGFRVLSLRIAQREAALRANVPLLTLYAERTSTTDERAVAVMIDIAARSARAAALGI